MNRRTMTPNKTAYTFRRARTALRLFQRTEDGSILIFSVMMFTLMLLIAGISLDIERFESARTRLQAVADGSALAAASLSQQVPAETLVADYFDKAGLSQYYNGVTVVQDVNSNEVEVFADVNVPTHFFNMIGVENLHTVIRSVAAESIDKIEISLVLDVSGSMGQNNKIGNLVDAAEEFVDIIYDNTPADAVSISVVPYSTQVSAGPELMGYLTGLGTSAHTNSYCLDFQGTDFGSTELDLAAAHLQTVHMDARTGGDWGWQPDYGLWYNECPTYGWTDVLVMSQNRVDLKAYFNQFTNTDWTSIETGVKWGAAMLDPSLQDAVTGMIANGSIDTVFAGRPAQMDDPETMKVMVVMTDGINTNQFIMDDPYRSGPSPIYVWHDADDRPYYSIWNDPASVPITDEVLVGGVPQQNWYLANDYGGGVLEGWGTIPLGGPDAVRMDWSEVWTDIPVKVITNDWFSAMGSVMNAEKARINAAFNVRGRADKDPYTRQICTSAKDAGITIYTIGFEAPNAAQILLRDCASSPSHAFDVDGTEIGQAFAAIAADVTRLRLLH